MNLRMQEGLAMVIALALLLSILAGCGISGGGPALEDMPLYPNATESEYMEQSSPGGIMSAKLAQYTTSDPYDEVLEFYTAALDMYQPEFMNHTTDLGRVTAISIPQKKGMITVAIQEFAEDGKVNITFMAAGI